MLTSSNVRIVKVLYRHHISVILPPLSRQRNSRRREKVNLTVGNESIMQEGKSATSYGTRGMPAIMM